MSRMLNYFAIKGDGVVLLKNFASLFVLRGIQFIIPLLVLPYLVRTIGIENYGLINFASSLALYFGAIIQFGFGITATREIARHRNDALMLARIYSSTLTASVLLSVVSAIFFYVVVHSIDKFNDHLLLYLFVYLLVVFQSLFPVWFFQGVERMKYITFLSLGASILFLISLFFFVKSKDDYVLVPMINAIAAFFVFLISNLLIRFHFNVKFEAPSLYDLKCTYKNGYDAFVGQFAPNLYNNTAVFLLGLFSNNLLVGFYTSAIKIIDAVISFGYILSNTFLPYISRDLTRHKPFQKLMFLAGLFLTFSTFLMAEWIVVFMFGLENSEVSTYVKSLSISIIFVFTYLTYNTNYLMLSAYSALGRNISLYISLLASIWTVILTYYFDIYGAILSLLLARGGLSIASYFYYERFKI